MAKEPSIPMTGLGAAIALMTQAPNEQWLWVVANHYTAKQAGFDDRGIHRQMRNWRVWWPECPVDRLYGLNLSHLILTDGAFRVTHMNFNMRENLERGVAIAKQRLRVQPQLIMEV